jgi:hypothetical protein
MLEVMGERFQELACLEAAEAIEAALGVATRVDPVLEAAVARADRLCGQFSTLTSSVSTEY